MHQCVTIKYHISSLSSAYIQRVPSKQECSELAKKKVLPNVIKKKSTIFAGVVRNLNQTTLLLSNTFSDETYTHKC